MLKMHATVLSKHKMRRLQRRAAHSCCSCERQRGGLVGWADQGKAQCASATQKGADTQELTAGVLDTGSYNRHEEAHGRVYKGVRHLQRRAA